MGIMEARWDDDLSVFLEGVIAKYNAKVAKVLKEMRNKTELRLSSEEDEEFHYGTDNERPHPTTQARKGFRQHDALSTRKESMSSGTGMISATQSSTSSSSLTAAAAAAASNLLYLAAMDNDTGPASHAIDAKLPPRVTALPGLQQQEKISFPSMNLREGMMTNGDGRKNGKKQSSTTCTSGTRYGQDQPDDRKNHSKNKLSQEESQTRGGGPAGTTGGGGAGYRRGPRYGNTKIELPADFQPTDKTVICGRSKQFFNSKGNALFRQIVRTFVQNYVQAGDKIEKSDIVNKIIQLFRELSPKGAFVRYQDGKWWEVGDAYAREKVGAQFREFLHPQYSSSTKAKLKMKKKMKQEKQRLQQQLKEEQQQRLQQEAEA